jgi:hypothetical protein
MSSSASSASSLLHYQHFLIVGTAFLSVWYVLLLQLHPQQDHHQHSSKHAHHDDHYYKLLITYAPLWLIIGLGIYALSSVIYGTLTFHDTPEAAEELEQQIQQAKQEMIQRGIINPSK